MAKGSISISDLYRIVVSAPTSDAQLNSDGWKKHSLCYECLKAADGKRKNKSQQRDYEIVLDYFCQEFPNLSDKTRSIIVSTFTSMVDVLNRGVLSDLFGGKTNITPDAIANGAIIVVDLPIKEFATVGQFAQVLWKTTFQRAMERRNVRKNPRPVFLWADECNSSRPHTTSSFKRRAVPRVATVYLTQTISNFYAALGGNDLGKSQTDSLAANLNLKIMHANGDPVTNEWCSSLIGRSRQFLTNSNSTQNPAAWPTSWMGLGSAPTTSAGVSETIDFEVQPRRFTTLRRGGRINRRQVDGIIFAGGKRFNTTGRTWMPVTFKQ